MKKKFTHLLLLGTLLLWPLSPWAQTVSSLYSSRIPVISQDENELQRAMQQGFAQVILRNTSVANALGNARISSAMTSAQSYVISFRYAPLNNPPPDSTHRFNLLLQFDEKAIKKLLGDAGLPIWGGNRPPLLVWWVVKSDGEPTLVNQETAPDIVAALSEQAQLRGIPLIFPLLDIQDNESLQPNDVWNFFLDKAKAASQRYGHENILLGRSDFLNDFGESRWVLLLSTETLNASPAQGQVQAMLGQAINFAADQVAQRYALSKPSSTQIDIRLIVSDISTLQTFAALEDYFQQLDVVKKLRVSTIKGNEVTLAFSLNTDMAQFEKILQLDNKLEKQASENVSASAPVTEPTHYYRWKGHSEH